MAFTSKIGGGRGSSGSKGLGTGKNLSKNQRKKYAKGKLLKYTVNTLGKAGGSAVLAGGLLLKGLTTDTGKKIKKKIDKVDDFLKSSNKKENIDSPSGAKTVFQNKEDNS